MWNWCARSTFSGRPATCHSADVQCSWILKGKCRSAYRELKCPSRLTVEILFETFLRLEHDLSNPNHRITPLLRPYVISKKRVNRRSSSPWMGGAALVN